ncbi:MAG: hypothetical protein GWN67_14535 [Phycisphaerae bacterium]|nr:hypothetical protein [Phycisphaerae bacterium]NIS52349.1 hypothetical protein [Phycisphaerae bacterium]NIU57554.1 hypothetical protein [Phycisphaerae bacterium]NIW94052.1 hypothetical protein [Phycisphaerae bacterium]
MIGIIFLTLLISVNELPAAEATDSEKTTVPVRSKKTYVLVVSGINKDPNERLEKDKSVSDLRNFFLDSVKIEAGQLSILMVKSSSADKTSQIPTAENLKKTIDTLARSIKPQDRFIFYYLGQANVVTDKLRFNLPGEDITHEKLAEWLNKISASSTLIVLDCPAAGLAAKAMTCPGRIIVCACTSEQRYSTQFSRYFIPALVDRENDIDADGRVSLLEAFTSTSQHLDNFYRQRQLLKTETPVLEDNQDGIPSRHPWRFEIDGKDGRTASKFFLSE